MFKYRNKENNTIIESRVPIKDKRYVLISWIENMMMKANKIIKK